MNAESLLRSQGWRGTGHSLDAHGRGIKKPLLIAHKQDQLGLGKRKAEQTVDDQWWMRAFDESLKSFGTGQKSTLAEVREKGVRRGGLYGFFVRGEGLVGTISDESTTAGTNTPKDDDTGSASKFDKSEDSPESGDSEASPKFSKRAKTKKNQGGKAKRKRAAEDEGSTSKKSKQEDGAVPVKMLPAIKSGSVETYLGTFGPEDCARINEAMRNIGDQVNMTVRTNEKRGVYGTGDEGNAGKTASAKTRKIERQKVIRGAKKAITQDLVIEALVKGDLPNSENLSKEQLQQNYEKVKKALEAVKVAESQIRRKEVKAVKEARKIEIAEKNRAFAKQAKEEKERQKAAATALSLPPQKKAEYEARATQKGQTLEEYIARRKEKKESKRMARAPDRALFFVDTEGDPNMATRAGPVTYEALDDGSCPLDPSIWKGREVKTLPKAVCEGRRIARGKPVRDASRGMKKLQLVQKRTGEELTKMGVTHGATKEQMAEARKKAKRAMKDEKREKKYGERGSKRRVKGKTKTKGMGMGKGGAKGAKMDDAVKRGDVAVAVQAAA